MKRESSWVRFKRSYRFTFERLLVRGPQYRLLVLGLLLAVLAVLGGLLAYVSPVDDFRSPREAIWWALLRMSDSGYLGEETEPWMRFLALLLTVVGLAVFVGGLIAVVTQWFTDTMERLTMGLTPIRRSDHVVVLGWSNRAVEIVEALLLAKEPFAVASIAMLVDRITPERVQTLRQRLGKRAARRIIMRSGDPRRVADLDRVDAVHARAVIMPRLETGDEVTSPDMALLQVAANLAGMRRSDEGAHPLLAAELSDPRLLGVAVDTYRAESLIMSTDFLVGGALALGAISPGLSFLFSDLLDARDGVTFGLAQYPELVGRPLITAVKRLPQATVLGSIRGVGMSASPLQPDPNFVLEADDRLVLVYDVDSDLDLRDEPPSATNAEPALGPLDAPPVGLRLLILGWNGRVPQILLELTHDHARNVSIDIVAATPVERREEALVDIPTTAGFEIRQMAASPSDPTAFERLDLRGYDRVVVMGGDLYRGRDSTSLAAYLMLQHALNDAGATPHVLLELPHPDTEATLARYDVEVVDTTSLVADTLAGVVVHPELMGMFRAILERKFGAIETMHVDAWLTEARPVDLLQLELQLRPHGVTLLGVQRATGHPRVVLSPDKSVPLDLSPGDRLIFFRKS